MTKKLASTATAVADLHDSVILARVEIAAPPERVFRALTTDEITKWWGANEYKTTKHVVDLRPGGKWRSDGESADGSPFHVEGEVVEVDPPRRLVQTWRASWDGGAPTTIVYALDEIDGGTRVTVRHFGFTNAASCDGHAIGWQRVLGWLTAFVQGADPRRAFFLRLIPPRPTFPADANPEELVAIGEHAKYVRGKLAEGVGVAFGPIADPKGTWGFGVVRVANDDELAAFIAADPAVKSGLGFRYESLPIMSLVS